MTPRDEAAVERWEQDQRDRELDDDAADRVQDAYERSLGWTHD